MFSFAAILDNTFTDMYVREHIIQWEQEHLLSAFVEQLAIEISLKISLNFTSWTFPFVRSTVAQMCIQKLKLPE